MSKRNLIILAIVGIIGGTIALCLFCGLVGMLADSSDRQPTAAARATLPPLESAPTEPPTATPEPEEPTATPVPATPFASPEDELRFKLDEALGDTVNRDDKIKSVVVIRDDVILVRFAIDDSFTNDMIRTGADLDIKSILKAVADSHVPYTILNIEGTFALVDALGNSSEETVVWATYDAATISQINWVNFSTKNIYTIATTHKFHPAFEE